MHIFIILFFNTDAIMETNSRGGQQSQQVKNAKVKKLLANVNLNISHLINFFCISAQRDEDLLTYAAPTFNKRKPRKADRKTVKPAEAETTYSDIRTF